MNEPILITGGAGYIGSHMAWYLRDRGHAVVVLDNLSSGHAEAIGDTQIIRGNAGDRALLETLFSQCTFRAVMHFASFIEVGESVRQPHKYHANNVVQSLALMEAVKKYRIPSFVFSSSAAVYGTPDHTPISEDHPTRPINPYGQNKREVEQSLAASGLRHGILRYFNAAGADPQQRTGEWHEPESHLIPRLLQAADRGETVTLYGDDYPTPDGTCIRDYVHVNDICDAHLKLLEYLESGGAETVFNIGTGRGYSVMEVLNAVREVTNAPIPHAVASRRPGDPPALVADGSKARALLKWKPRCSDLYTLISHAWAWERKRQR